MGKKIGQVLIIEGANGVGKTTFINKDLMPELKEAGLDYRLFKFPSPKHRSEKDLLGISKTPPSVFLEDQITVFENEIAPAFTSCQRILVDRAFLSTLVYQGLINAGLEGFGTKRFLDNFKGLIEHGFKNWQGVILILDRPLTAMIKNLEKRRGKPLDEVEKQHLKLIKQAYNKAWRVFIPWLEEQGNFRCFRSSIINKDLARFIIKETWP